MIHFLAIDWSVVGVKGGQLLLALSILVVLHEFGHYITAKWFKCRVEKFYLFFDPWFSLFKKKVGETEYGVGWLPLGGYVKISGMIDESMDKEQLKQPAQPWEFRSKPAWQRLIIMLGGILMNVLVAFVIYAFVLMIWGESKTPMASVKNGIWLSDSLMYNIGLRNGDKIIAVNDKKVNYFETVQTDILLGGEKVTLEREGKVMDVALPVDLINTLITRKDKKRRTLMMMRVPAYVGKYNDKDSVSLGKKAGLQELDKIVAVDSVPVQFYDELSSLFAAKKNDSVLLSVERSGQMLSLVSAVDSAGKIGVPLLNEIQYDSLGAFTTVHRKYGFFEAFPAGVRKTGEQLALYYNNFKMILKPETGAYKGVGGFKSMGSIFPETWNWEAFWNLTAFLSIILAFMNLLPIPGLDGGHVMFTLWEMITGRKPSDKFLEYATIVGFVILIALMLYANLNDFIGWAK